MHPKRPAPILDPPTIVAPVPLILADQHELVSRYYNAQVVGVRRCHEDLLVLRAQPDGGVPHFTAGQYIALGLGYWEPRIVGTQEERLEADSWARLAKRAYSISCTLVDDCGKVVRAKDCPYLEFYVALVRRRTSHRP